MNRLRSAIVVAIVAFALSANAANGPVNDFGAKADGFTLYVFGVEV